MKTNFKYLIIKDQFDEDIIIYFNKYIINNNEFNFYNDENIIIFTYNNYFNKYELVKDYESYDKSGDVLFEYFKIIKK